MKLDFGNLNNQMSNAPAHWGMGGQTSPKNNQLSFKGVGGAIDGASDALRRRGGELARDVSSGVRGKFSNFVRENITSGAENVFDNPEDIFAILRRNFGSTFDEYRDEVQRFVGPDAGEKSPLRFLTTDGVDKMIVHRDPFALNVANGIKEFTVGNVLDIGVGIRKQFRKLTGTAADATQNSAKKGFLNKILDKRATEVSARESFYKLAGVFEAVTDENELAKLSGTRAEKIAKRAQMLAQDSIGKATKKVGNYNTKSERAWNRMGTGFVSATFAATDFYNISMLQNNDPEKANKAGKKRFLQDMRRQLLTASMTFVVLGAFQKKVNNSIAYAVLSLGGVTLLSEVISRLAGGISLTPLSPEQAKKIAEKRGHKTEDEDDKADKANNANEVDDDDENDEINEVDDDDDDDNLTQVKNLDKSSSLTAQNNSNQVQNVQSDNIFSVFTDKLNDKTQNNISFKSNKIDNQTPQSEKSLDETKDGENKKKSPLYQKILKVVGGIVAASLAVGFLRTKNVLRFDDLCNAVSKKYRDFSDKVTTKRLIMKKEDVDKFTSHLEGINFSEQALKIKEKLNLDTKELSASDELVKKFYKGAVQSGDKFYDLGYVDSKVKKTAYSVLTYPINTAGKLLKKGDNLVRILFGAKPSEEVATEIQKGIPLAEMVKKYTTKLQGLKDGDKTAFNKEIQTAFTRHFSESNSKNKNTSVAMLSRFLITLISGYFFVNDYRNEVLIESKGEDIDRANATMKERIGHKVSNFILNSMFMDLFNSTFERFYLASVPGATMVAMATEVTNESAVRASICTPRTKMNRDELIEYENKRLNDSGLKGKYYRGFMKLTGKKPLSEKANKGNKKQEQKTSDKGLQNSQFQYKNIEEFMKASKGENQK